MITASVISAKVNSVVLALTPIERWQASRFNSNFFMAERWFILTGAAAIIILSALLIIVSYQRKAKERKISNMLFLEYADKRGLSQRERQILLDIATKTKLKRNESIFTMASAFDLGAAKIIEKARSMRGAETTKNLCAELSILCEKLGFPKQRPASVVSAIKSNKPSSRQITTGKKLHITRQRTGDFTNIESTVIENNDVELTVRLTTPVESKPGELWCVRYYFGASVWEFETSSVSCNDNILVLNHSDNVRFINRRRFLRVPVSKPAFIAQFPFAKTLPLNDINNNSRARARQGLKNVSGNTWGPPEFVPAAVTELAGPGLRIEAPLKVKVGDRVVVILKINEEGNQDSIPHQKGTLPASNQIKTGKKTPAKIVEDIGEVRHTKAIQNGFSIAVELTGLSDTNINELIRETNAASLIAGAKTQDVPASSSSENNKEAKVPEQLVVQGV